MPRPDRQEITCHWPASDASGHFSFKALFSGSHDDTTASLNITLNGQALRCENGSKVELTGVEEGDVALECRFTVMPISSGTAHALKAQVAWHHAQYVNHQLSAR